MRVKIEKIDKIKYECFNLIMQGQDKPISSLGAMFDNLCDPKSAMAHFAPKWLEKPVTVRTQKGKRVYLSERLA